ncbi:hypothetical protein K450DRAFT_260884 [Umbelopsis ramanniana AG]|uniref:Reverse transcriptase zinc-binding domain-containing protein n=1 Tax=Umbelopsis ramanniana AG TaxID=1314678 RepID=A0AAD5E0M5_UMBRA|nr:uncharacterized protein K450DRAFT_260884 [Umbelopsis ramanniana AG]KAI8575608.1 hypothetical protein K450DRAFT_260884 [Umbelopsis ramanniana AG]
MGSCRGKEICILLKRFVYPGTGRTRNPKKKKDDIQLRINGLGSPAISGKAWKLFWSMDIPHAIRTPWWRTLQQKIPTKERLHNIFPGEHSTTCTICQKENESYKHFWVECEKKNGNSG